MEDKEQGVTPAESPTAPAEETATPTPAEGQTQETSTEATPAQGQEQPSAPVTEEVNWKNRAYEYERKLRETTESLPKIIEEIVAKNTPKQEAAPQYSIEQLEVFAEQTDDVNSKLWAKAEIKKLEEQRWAKIIDERVGAVEQKKNYEIRKNEVEREVANDPRYSEAFIVDASGRKMWNNNSPLTQMAANYIKDPDVAKRPDGLAIAMKLAFADYATMKTGVAANKVESLKKENTKLKQSTLVDGGTNIQAPKSNPLTQAKEELAKTGSKTALRTLVQAHLKAQGLIS